jgi:hypothetical protein
MRINGHLNLDENGELEEQKVYWSIVESLL